MQRMYTDQNIEYYTQYSKSVDQTAFVGLGIVRVLTMLKTFEVNLTRSDGTVEHHKVGINFK
jgi:hypothetical protein